MKLENWALVNNGGSCCIKGCVYGNPRFDDGKVVITSTIVAREGNNLIVTRSGSRYLLGVVDPDYEAQYPNSRERLFNTLQELNQGLS